MALFCLCGVVTGLLLLSCRIKTWDEFVRDESAAPIVMFDRYSVDFWSIGWPGDNTFISFSYLRDIKDTTHLDTLPILVLDSICFAGTCLNNASCLRPTSWRESWKQRGKEPEQDGVLYLRKPRACLPLKYEDLFYIEDMVVPQGYDQDIGYSIPRGCVGTTVTVTLKAHLLNRVTGQEIARETKEMPFMIQEKKKRVID
jgi:hypothetical protein